VNKYILLGAAAAVLLGAPVRAYAQTDAGGGTELTVQDILRRLMLNEGVQTDDFEKDLEAAETTSATLTRALLSAIATLPVSTSASGFTYRLNPMLGTVERASETFGPFFVERALTAGAGQASLGFTFQYASFTALDGHDLRDGQFVTTANQFSDEPAPFAVETLTLAVNTSTATFYGNVGLSDRVDVGVAVPVVRLDVSGTRDLTYRGQILPQIRARAETVGLADIAVRSKFRLTGDGPGAVAAGIEARLPTGREEDLLGAGELAMRFQGLASAEAGRTSVHGNFTLGTGGVGREISYGGAVAIAATPQFTVIGEVLARRITGVQRISEVIAPHPNITCPGQAPTDCVVNTMRLIPNGEDQTTAFAVTGFKWNVGGTWLLHGHVLWPMTDSGLTTKLTPTVALDYSFTR
jgi:hypothetical protein